jgi:toxin ParE1/3/4
VKWRVIIRPRAEIDLREARDWYEEQQSGLGQDFLAETARAIQRLAQNPELSPEYYRGFRRVTTRRFPYKMFYRLEADRIILFPVLHGRRDHPLLLSRES